MNQLHLTGRVRSIPRIMADKDNAGGDIAFFKLSVVEEGEDEAIFNVMVKNRECIKECAKMDKGDYVDVEGPVALSGYYTTSTHKWHAMMSVKNAMIKLI